MTRDFRGAYGRPKCAWCHKRHRNGTVCPVRDRETKPKAAAAAQTETEKP